MMMMLLLLLVVVVVVVVLVVVVGGWDATSCRSRTYQEHVACRVPRNVSGILSTSVGGQLT